MKAPHTLAIRGLTLIMTLILFHPVLFGADARPAPTLVGTWKWTFAMPDGGTVTPILKLKQEADKLTGTTRFRAGTETAVTNLTVKEDVVSFQVVREREGRPIITQYTGTRQGATIKGKIVSNWSGENQSYDWEAQRLADAEGSWKWTNNSRQFTMVSTLKLKQDGEKITGKLSAGGRGGGRRGGETDIQNGAYKEGEISFETEREREGEKTTNRFYGKITGDTIKGKMELNFFGAIRTNDWEAVRAD